MLPHKCFESRKEIVCVFSSYFRHSEWILNDCELSCGMEFEIDQDTYSHDEEYFQDETSNFLKEEFSKYCSLDDDEEIDISMLSVTELKQKMTPVTDDGLVLKLETSPGSGPIIPPNSRVLIHYNAFVEDQKEPFDSTYKRGAPFKFILGAGKIVYGLDNAISTMRKGEFAKFWIHYDYAYGAIGCPPRIPECANIVYEVEILNYFDCKDAIEFEEMLPDDQRKAPFDKVLVVCGVELTMGNKLFNKKNYPASIPRYLKAVKLLETVNAANETDDKNRESMLFKLYMNLSICYLHVKNAKRAICFGHKALHIDKPIQDNTRQCKAKALYQLGKAYELDCCFDDAKKYLLSAQKLKLDYEEIDTALLKLVEHQKQAQQREKIFCQRMFQSSSKISNNEFLSQESPEFVSTIKNQIETFKASEDSEYTFPSTFTPSQIGVIKAVIESQGLCFFEKIDNGQKIIKVKKAT